MEELIRIEPKQRSAKVLRTLARAYSKWAEETSSSSEFIWDIDIEKYTKATENYRDALSFLENASDPDFILQVAMTYQLLADFPKALGCFGEIIVSFPTYKRMNIVALRSSILLTQQGQFGRAAQYLEYILESPPEKYDQHDIIFS